ncbi:MAG: NHL repeat-containing protein [Planctomycetes bacterium]|nr:NHL repeat-containing protein [Planctomycetota bacterium]
MLAVCVVAATSAQAVAAQDESDEYPVLKADVMSVLDERNAGFRDPRSVAVDPKTWDVYVADGHGNIVFVFSETGRQKATLPIRSPCSIAVDSRGALYVADDVGGIALYDVTGRKLRDIKPKGLPDGAVGSVARQLLVVDDELFVLDAANKALLHLGGDGKVLRHYGVIGNQGKGMRFGDVKAAWVNRNRVYVIDGTTSRVSVFTRHKGELLFTFAERGGSPKRLAVPVGIVADKEDRVYVLDTLRHCITLFDDDGKPIGECGGEGTSPGWFSFPFSLTRDEKGRLYVCETQQKRVQILTIPVDTLAKPREDAGK